MFNRALCFACDVAIERALRRYVRRRRCCSPRRLGCRRRWRGRRLGCRALANDADGRLEGQALGLEESCRHALAVADNGREHDGPIDLHVGARALSRRGLGIGEDLGEVRIVDRQTAGCGGRRLLAEKARNVVAQAPEVDRIGDEDARGIRILGEGQKQVLERDGAMGLAGGIVARARKRRDQQVGPRNPRLERRRLSHRLGHRLSCSGGPSPAPCADLVCRAAEPEMGAAHVCELLRA
jgi:hypothetical protein